MKHWVHLFSGLFGGLIVLWFFNWWFLEKVERVVIIDYSPEWRQSYQSEIQRCEGCALEMETFVTVHPSIVHARGTFDSALYGWSYSADSIGQVEYLTRDQRFSRRETKQKPP